MHNNHTTITANIYLNTARGCLSTALTTFPLTYRQVNPKQWPPYSLFPQANRHTHNLVWRCNKACIYGFKNQTSHHHPVNPKRATNFESQFRRCSNLRRDFDAFNNCSFVAILCSPTVTNFTINRSQSLSCTQWYSHDSVNPKKKPPLRG
jgi:hypothetical protein